MSFKTKGYETVSQVVSEEMSTFLFNYLILKRRAVKYMIDTKYLPPNKMGAHTYGDWYSDPQALDTYSVYGDAAIETLLMKLLPLVENKTKLTLIPCYGYGRIYKKGDVLSRHRDRVSCEISLTLFIGGDPWIIYLDPTGKRNQKGVPINLKIGEMLLFRGETLEHWRNKFKGETCAQIFLHYNNAKDDSRKKNKFDGRVCLGLPARFKNLNK
jgi:alkylated DNA repair dioxygenase AlkB